jgi:hypothetical protein
MGYATLDYLAGFSTSRKGCTWKKKKIAQEKVQSLYLHNNQVLIHPEVFLFPTVLTYFLFSNR